MEIKNHITMLVITVVGWAVFYLMGLPSDYYTHWSSAEKMLILWIGFFAILPFICVLVIIFLKGDYLKLSLWLAFYASVILFIFDFIVVGLIEKKGLGFLLTHWPQSIGYIEAWIVMPLIGYALKKFKKQILSRNS